MPFEIEPVRDWDFALGSGGNAEVANDRDDDRRCRALLAAFAAALAAIAAFKDILEVGSTVFSSTSFNAQGEILIQKKNSFNLLVTDT